MPRKSNKKKADAVRDLWNKASTGDRGRWRRINQRGYDFYLNDQPIMYPSPIRLLV